MLERWLKIPLVLPCSRPRSSATPEVLDTSLHRPKGSSNRKRLPRSGCGAAFKIAHHRTEGEGHLPAWPSGKLFERTILPGGMARRRSNAIAIPAASTEKPLLRTGENDIHQFLLQTMHGFTIPQQPKQQALAYHGAQTPARPEKTKASTV